MAPEQSLHLRPVPLFRYPSTRSARNDLQRSDAALRTRGPGCTRTKTNQPAVCPMSSDVIVHETTPGLPQCAMSSSCRRDKRRHIRIRESRFEIISNNGIGGACLPFPPFSYTFGPCSILARSFLPKKERKPPRRASRCKVWSDAAEDNAPAARCHHSMGLWVCGSGMARKRLE